MKCFAAHYSVLPLAICSLSVILSSCSGVQGIPGGLIGNTFHGIEFVDISTGANTLLVAKRLGEARFGPLAYDSRRHILYYVDKVENCVKASTGGTQMHVVYRIPKVPSDLLSVECLLLDSSGDKLYMDVSYNLGDIDQLVCLDVPSGKVEVVSIGKKFAWMAKFEWIKPGEILLRIQLDKGHSRYDELGDSYYLAAMNIDTGNFRVLTPSSGCSTSLMPGRMQVVVEKELDYDKRFRLRKLPGGEIIKHVDPPSILSGRPLYTRGAVGLNNRFFAAVQFVRPHYIGPGGGTYVIDSETSEATRLTRIPLRDMTYVNDKPKFRSNASLLESFLHLFE